MKETICTGQTGVGDVKLSAHDVGYDLKQLGITIRLPGEFSSVGIDRDGEIILIEGTRDEMVEAIRAAGYRLEQN